ncbi:MAG TPA: HAD-IA family hydrolase [Gaiellaceae bacterium]|nr:HAD-IA family hydrolase [Gaiellaceae bacterium]
MNVVFDAFGTLFEPASLRESLGEAGFEAWFERTLQSAATMTLLGEFVAFADLARSTLATTCAILELDVDQDDVIAQLSRLPPAGDARAALEQVRANGGRDFVLTNGGREAGEELVERAGFGDLVERVFGVDEVRAYKPDPRPYRLVLDTLGGEATLVAAHAFDVVGAVRSGMRGVWVDRHERVWPFPAEVVPHATAGNLMLAADVAQR